MCKVSLTPIYSITILYTILQTIHIHTEHPTPNTKRTDDHTIINFYLKSISKESWTHVITVKITI